MLKNRHNSLTDGMMLCVDVLKLAGLTTMFKIAFISLKIIKIPTTSSRYHSTSTMTFVGTWPEVPKYHYVLLKYSIITGINIPLAVYYNL